ARHQRDRHVLPDRDYQCSGKPPSDVDIGNLWVRPEPRLERSHVIDDRPERIHTKPRNHIVRLKVSHAANLQLPDVEVRHPVHRRPSPSGGREQRRCKDDPGQIPIAGLLESLGKLQEFLVDESRMSRSSRAVRVMSPAPTVITTSPARTSVDSASASAGLSPLHANVPPAAAIACSTRSELTPGIGFSRAGYSSVRKITSAPDRALPNSRAKSRVRL